MPTSTAVTMCGIIGYIGSMNASRIVLEGLKHLEYRGYDSVGFAGVLNGSLIVKKDVGKVDDVHAKLNFLEHNLNLAIGHTRWATHGRVTKTNAHPHIDCRKDIAIVHNGIIENYEELKNELVSKGHVFRSRTDSEVVAHLIEEEANNAASFEEACFKAFSRLEGAYAILAIDRKDYKIVAIKKGSPLVIGLADHGSFAASDIPAFINYTKKVVYLYDYDMVVLKPDPVFYNIENGNLVKVERPIQSVEWDAEKARKGEFEHFMLKEIMEQVDTVQRAADQDKKILEKIANEIKRARGIFLVGCGSSYHACLTASYVFSKVAREHVNVVLASEFPNYEHFLTSKTLIIAVSQSGETYDVLEAIRAGKKRGSKIISVVNVMGSSLARESDEFLLMHAGPEICVLSTKTYTSQIALLNLLAYTLAGRYEEGRRRLKYLWNVIYYLTSANTRNKIRKLAEKLADKKHIFCIGRGLQYPTAMEAALKIKEASYIHAEAFAGGELKHGTIALIEEGTPCIVFVSEENGKEILSNATEVKSRGGYIIGISPTNHEVFDFWIKVPECGTENPIVQIIPVQILAYQLAVLRGCDPDKPRNLAKSVTVK
ncbi:MAG: glutamine--fructose-6-phosphate transaminase (isomerizing) [Candidatus Brockarchaeota archaeon]|nr:glutamine--fructose-6-phosphate transaminase (isomerizing) [Candidatus Brockarchaeota archaeon]